MNPSRTLVAGLLLTSLVAAQDAFYNVTMFGATPNNASDDDVVGIMAAISQAYTLGQSGATIYFPPGRYDLYSSNVSEHSIVVPLPLILSGSGATLVQHLPDQGVLLAWNAPGTKVLGFEIDYDPLPFVQGTVVASGPGNTVDVQIDPGFLSPNDPKFLPDNPRYVPSTRYTEVVDSSGNWKTGTDFWNSSVSAPINLGNNRFRFTMVHPPAGGNPIALNSDRLVHLPVRNNGAGAVSFASSPDCLAVNVLVRATPGIAFFGIASGGTRINSCFAVPTSSSYLSTTTSAFLYFRAGTQGITVENCYGTRIGDDAIDIGVAGAEVRDLTLPLSGGVVVASVAVPQQNGYVAVGDTLQLTRGHGGELLGTVSPIAVGQTYVVNEEFWMDLTFPTGSGLNIGDVLFNLTQSLPGTAITNCVFDGVRGGMLIKPHGTTLTDVTITRMLSGISIGADREHWKLGPVPANITLDNVTMDDCCSNHTSFVSGVFDVADIYARDVAGLTMLGVTIQNGRRQPALRIHNCSGTLVDQFLATNTGLTSPDAQIMVLAGTNATIQNSVVTMPYPLGGAFYQEPGTVVFQSGNNW